MRAKLVGAVTAFGVAVAATVYWSTRPPEPVSSAEDVAASVLAAARQEACEVGNRIVSSRDLADAHLPADPPWKPEEPWAVDTLFAGLPAAPSTIVVYVHGYNTPLTEAIRNGSYLAREIRSANPAGAGALAFYTFSWRGDFGASKFSEAEASADKSGPALADFLQTLLNSRPTPSSRIVVLAHSLGVRLALVASERLWQRAHRIWLDDLVLVQAAVPAANLYVGTVSTFLSPRRSQEAAGTGDALVVVEEHHQQGAWVDGLAAARRVIVTVSPDDEVLNVLQRAHAFDYGAATAYRYVPELTVALGIIGVLQSTLPTDYTEIALKTTALPAAARGHSGLFVSPDLIRLLWAGIAVAPPAS